MVFLPSVKCSIGSENGYSDEKPIHDFEINGFYMDAKLVTNAEFKVFCDSTGRGYPAEPLGLELKNILLTIPTIQL